MFFKSKVKQYQTKEEWFERNGYNADGSTLCIVGQDTYAIKEHLKEAGCKYCPILKWHYSDKDKEMVEKYLDESFKTIKVHYNEIMEWDADTRTMLYKENAKEVIDKYTKTALGPSLSKYMGKIGERLRNLTVVYKSVRGFSGAYGWTNIYTFEHNNNVLVWFTEKDLDCEPGATLDLTGTVIKHEEFRSVETTKINRCKVIVID